MPHKLDYSKINQCLDNAEDNPNLSCKLLKSLRLRINTTKDEYIKHLIAKEYIDEQVDFQRLLKSDSILVKGYALSLIHTLLNFKEPR